MFEMIYLDNAATTKVDEEVLEEIHKLQREIYGNPTSKYYEQAKRAKEVVEESKEIISTCLNCSKEEVIFTSGATEGNNTVLKGIAGITGDKKHIITSKAEHSSVFKTCKYLETIGFEVTYLDVDKKGLINLDELKSSIKDNTALVSIMYVNNELGSINNIDEIDKICYEKSILFHSDMTQAIGKIEIDLSMYKSLFAITYSSHKIYGPKGVGVMIIRKDEDGLKRKLTPLLHGGNNQDYRSTTIDFINAFGCALATKKVCEDIKSNNKKLKDNEKEMIKVLDEYFKDNYELNNDYEERIPGILNVWIQGRNNQLLSKKISSKVALSTGSACSINEPSRVLTNAGFEEKRVKESIRISSSIYTKFKDKY